MPLIQRYQASHRGAMILVGNTLNIMWGTAYPPSTQDYINGAYISTNTSLIAATGFPRGTTFSQAASGSSVVVNIPSGSTIMYAQLFWSLYNNPPNIDGNVTFVTPVATQVLSPNLALKQAATYQTFQATDVKTLIQQGGSGTYTLGNVPGVTVSNGGTFAGNGWGMIIVYQNDNLPLRYFNVNTGIALASASAPSDFNFTGFQTPSIGPITAYFLASESNGDIIDGAQILVGRTLATATKIGNAATGSWNGVAPYAQINTMLPGNILVADTNDINVGLLDTRGSFGTFNKNPFARTAPPFARVNMDILGVNISSNLANNQTTLFTRVTYTGSGTGHITSQSVQVDINSVNLAPLTKTVDKAYVDLGETLTYTFYSTNKGNVTASNAVFIDTIPPGTSFIVDSVRINDQPRFGISPIPPTGMVIGNIGPNTTTTIQFSVRVNTALPFTVTYAQNQATMTYAIIGNTTTVPDSLASNIVTTTITNITLSTLKVVDKNFADVGDTLSYAIRLSNLGNTTATNLLFVDTLPSDLPLVSGSFKQDSTLVSGTPNPPGVILPNALGPNQTTTITFQIKVTTLPSVNPIPNSAATSTSYIIDPSLVPNRVGAANAATNSVSTQVNHADLTSSSKRVDKNAAACGDTLTYTIVVPNSGNMTAINVLLKDTVPNGTTFVTGSVRINDVRQIGSNPQTGIYIGTLANGSVATVTFDVVVQC